MGQHTMSRTATSFGSAATCALALFMTAASGAAPGGDGQEQDKSWQAAGGTYTGAFTKAAYWDLGSKPDGDDRALFDVAPGPGYRVWFRTDEETGQIQFTRGEAIFEWTRRRVYDLLGMTLENDVDAALLVTSPANDDSTLTFLRGAVNIDDDVYIGRGADTDATVVLKSTAWTLLRPKDPIKRKQGPPHVATVGDGGRGRLLFEDPGSSVNGGAWYVAVDNADEADASEIVVRGTVTAGQVSRPSWKSDWMQVGVDGDGRLTLDDEAWMIVNGSLQERGLIIGVNEEASGLVQLIEQGGNVLNDVSPQLFINHGLVIGQDGVGELKVGFGCGVYETSGAESAVLGAGDTGEGTLVLEGGGAAFHCGTLYVGDKGTGTITVNENSTMKSGRAYLGWSADASGEVTLDGFDAIWKLGGETVTVSHGCLTVMSNASLETGGGTIGVGAGTSAVVLVTLDGVWTSTDDIVVGHTGEGASTGTLNLVYPGRVVAKDGDDLKKVIVQKTGVLKGSKQINVGDWSIDGHVKNDGGTVNPGNSPGRLAISGDYEQTPEGVLQIEIGGLEPDTGYDVLEVAGTALLDGMLTIEVIDGFEPLPGDVFEIVHAGAVSGPGFESVVLLGWPNDLEVELDMLGSTLQVTVIGIDVCPWDLDGNGMVDALDLDMLLAAWGFNPGHPADLNGDEWVDDDDLAILSAHFGPCP